ncbi:hypothetical protein ABZU76_08020 [Amycolatopsis sp. NPDC005232]|uniref:hypothetical protein n=1 Tax=Amycolatopsis sp. NPDC005232 TaxID=3157027 RepID=UPI0033A89D4E
MANEDNPEDGQPDATKPESDHPAAGAPGRRLIPQFSATDAAQIGAAIQRAISENQRAITENLQLNTSAVRSAQSVAEALAEQNRQIQEQLRTVVRGVDWGTTIDIPAIDFGQQFRCSNFDAWLKPFTERVSEVFESIGTLRIEVLRDGAPDNWADLRDDQILSLLKLARAGIPITWVPRAAILSELLAVDEGQRSRVILAHAQDLLDDCRAAAACTHGGAFAEHAGFLHQAIDALDAGHAAAAQALSANVLDTLLRSAVEKPVKSRYYATMRQTIESAPLSLLSWAVTHWPVLEALTNFDGATERLPSSFNRHATAHAVGSVQYTPENAAIAVMAAASVLRQAHESNTAESAEESSQTA